MAALYVGTSGFSYPAWRGHFYPPDLPGGRMLAHYSERLTGVEVNGSFYRHPDRASLRRWRDRAPVGFRFCLKAHRSLTYSAAGSDRGEWAADFGRTAAALGDRGGPVLLQLPPTRQRDVAFLDGLLEALGRPAAVEPRHESWFERDVYGTIARHRGALVVTDGGSWPMAPRLELAGLAYLRLRRDYDAPALAAWREVVASELSRQDEVHVYFKHEVQGPERAMSLLHLAG
ncbi:MAG: DUF72 domain-containing protein [Candidatus Dormibacteraceae bacterium]